MKSVVKEKKISKQCNQDVFNFMTLSSGKQRIAKC